MERVAHTIGTLAAVFVMLSRCRCFLPAASTQRMSQTPSVWYVRMESTSVPGVRTDGRLDEEKVQAFFAAVNVSNAA